MRHLSTLTNILPVIAKSDTLSHTQTLTLKLSLLRDLRSNSIPIFTFGKSLSELERNVVNGIPWAISCLKDDAVEMDASLLMRDENVEQYVESDLPLLNTCLVENASWLRFAATKKFLEWRRGKMSTPLTNLQQSTGLGVSEMSLISLPSEGYAMARVGDHMDREERLARVRLAQWAGDMRREVRRKMQEEREEFERLEHQERVRWLAARLNEAINQTPETSLVTTSTSKSSPIVRPRSSFELSRRRRQHIVDRDPLGLVWVTERWGPRVSQSLVWIVEAGVVLGSGWVVWKYVVDSGLSGWFISSART
jgi:septin family protein